MRSILVSAFLAFVSFAPQAQVATANASPGILAPATVQQLMPPMVFFSGQSATVQLRNTGGMRFTDGKLVLAGLVDTGGYSTSVREKYQFYLLTEVPLTIGGKHLAPGAYGAGFVADGFVVMDIGGAGLLQTSVTHDTALQRPRPLQVMAGASDSELKLYLGRDYVTLRRAQ